MRPKKINRNGTKHSKIKTKFDDIDDIDPDVISQLSVFKTVHLDDSFALYLLSDVGKFNAQQYIGTLRYGEQTRAFYLTVSKLF